MDSFYNDSSDIVRCPYNKHHVVPRSRLQRHIVKCEQNFPPDYKFICPYDATHRFDKNKIAEHIKTCPIRQTVEGSFIQPSKSNDTISTPGNSRSGTDIEDSCKVEMEKQMNKYRTIFPKLPEIYKNRDLIDESKLERLNSFLDSACRNLPSDDETDVETDEFTNEDLESITSARAIGRGRLILRNNQCLGRIGRERNNLV